MKRETSQLNRQTADHPRVCQRCKRKVATHKKGSKRVFNTHGPDPSGSFYCLNSAEPVA